MDTVHVDCDSCVARGPACSDCVVTVLLGSPQHGVDLDGDEQQALAALAGAGLVPPLRLVPGARRVQAVQSPLEWTESVLARSCQDPGNPRERFCSDHSVT